MNFSLKITLLGLFSLLSLSSYTQQKNIIADKAELTLIGEGYEFTEGPAVDDFGNVFFTDQPNDRILKWDAGTNAISTYMQPSGRANGLYVDHDGNLLAAADENNELWRIDNEKNRIVILDSFKEKRLNGPNDIWVDPDGGIYFTDPYYQRTYWERETPEIEDQRVYYITPDMHEVKIVVHHMMKPNGIIGTPDGKTLYIADIGDQKTYSFTINDDGSLSNEKLFTPMGSDGMTLDNQGNVYLTGDGITVFNSEGKQIERIPIPKKWTANVTFGGFGQQLLFITAMDAVYTLKMNVHGVR